MSDSLGVTLFEMRSWWPVRAVRSGDVSTGDCIEWDGTLDRDGYGRARVDGRARPVHRLVWEESFGALARGVCVLHRCDNPPCINIEHLFLGTRADNCRDAALKGRARSGDHRGTKNGRAKIGPAQAAEIRALLDAGNLTQREVGRRFGISQSRVSEIKRGKGW